jgi:hypothetical protein
MWRDALHQRSAASWSITRSRWTGRLGGQRPEAEEAEHAEAVFIETR